MGDTLTLSNLSITTEYTVYNAQTSPFTNHLKSARCWMSSTDMNSNSLESGQHLIVKNSKSFVMCIAWPSDIVTKNNIHLSGIQRLNLGINIEDKVTVHKMDEFIITSLKHLKVSIVSDSDGSFSKDKGFIDVCTDVLYDLQYMTSDLQVEFIYRGAKRMLKVIELQDNQLHRLDPNTKFTFLLPESALKPQGIDKAITYDQIGGLTTEIKKIKEYIQLSLFAFDKFTSRGLKAPRGILLHGPPGTGKTLIAKAIAAQTNVNFVSINATDILSSFYGESEQKLRDIFDNARLNAPSILFIDEIDALCPKRNGTTGLDRRIITTLLTLMNGVSNDANDRFIVIGTTNRPDTIDEALRLPGRFDYEIHIDIPKKEARIDILKRMLESVKHSVSESDIETLAGNAHGYVGADLASILKEAAVSFLREVHSTRKNGVNDEDCVIEYRHLVDGMKRVRPSGMREICLEVPSVRWSDIGGQEETKKRLQEAIEWPIKTPEKFAQFGIKPHKGILLYGPPGCSKTLMAKALATESGLNFLAIKGPELFNKYVGESEKAVKEIFRKARAAAPSILFFDEIDSIAGKRGASGEGVSVGDRVISQLLTEMDGINGLSGVTIVAATNRPDTLDTALTRPGRLDRMLYIGPPDFEGRKSILKIVFAKMRIEEGVDVDKLAKDTEGFSGAEMTALCQGAGFAAMEECVDIDKVLLMTYNHLIRKMKISSRHFDIAIKRITPRITSAMIQFYNKYESSG